ncbi:dehydrogenase, partial [Salmonella enterica subsp. enterica serovar Enteritidis]|nr:dehydrogenase [Salmonella enterica subsp. enterica serovar Enteritidis]
MDAANVVFARLVPCKPDQRSVIRRNISGAIA